MGNLFSTPVEKVELEVEEPSSSLLTLCELDPDVLNVKCTQHGYYFDNKLYFCLGKRYLVKGSIECLDNTFEVMIVNLFTGQHR